MVQSEESNDFGSYSPKGGPKHEVNLSYPSIRDSEDLGYHPDPPSRGVIVVWWAALLFATVYFAFFYSIYMTLFHIQFLTTIWALTYGYATWLSITIGAHRLFCHRSFKAHPLLRLVLMLLFTAAGELSVYNWVRNHRLHHKYTETDADPHNSQRGFFYAHVGWLVCRRQPELIEKQRTIDMSDLEADPYLMFQKRYYLLLYVWVGVFLPMVVPCWLWGETLFNSFMSGVILRTVIGFNLSMSVNSVAHMFGTKPYTRKFHAVESPFVAFIALGEGWHNYHHTFPWDYRTSEFGQRFNVSATLIDMFHKVEWVWELRQATPDMVLHRVLNHGDGSHPSVTEQTYKTLHSG